MSHVLLRVLVSNKLLGRRFKVTKAFLFQLETLNETNQHLFYRLDFSESTQSPILPQKDLESPSRQTPIQQRKSVVNTPLPPVPTYSPMPVNKLAPHSLNQSFQEYNMSGSPPPVPHRPHALSMTSNMSDAYSDIRRQQRGKDGIAPESKQNKPRPLSIKLTRFVFLYVKNFSRMIKYRKPD